MAERLAGRHVKVQGAISATARSPEHSYTERRDELLQKLESVRSLAVDAEAFHAALNDYFSNGTWSTVGDLERRRDLNRMTCFLDHLGRTITALLDESRQAVQLATTCAG